MSITRATQAVAVSVAIVSSVCGSATAVAASAAMSAGGPPTACPSVLPAGGIATIAGTGSAGFSGDCGQAIEASLNHPYGLAIVDGVVYIGDEGNHRIRLVAP